MIDNILFVLHYGMSCIILERIGVLYLRAAGILNEPDTLNFWAKFPSRKTKSGI